MRGVVKWYDIAKGYGFILADGVEYMLHVNQLVERHRERQVRPGTVVNFRPNDRDRGKFATEIIITDEYTWVDLPPECSHNIAVRRESTGEVRVFHDAADARKWVGHE